MKSAPAKHTSSAHAQQQTAQKPLFHKQGVEEASHDVQAVHTLNNPAGTDAPFTPVFHHHPGIQTKLTIGQPGDKYEQEADTMAEKVVQRLALDDAPAAGQSDTPPIQAKCAECKKEEQLQKKEEPEEVKEPEVQAKEIFESNEESVKPEVQTKPEASAPMKTFYLRHPFNSRPRRKKRRQMGRRIWRK